MDPHWFQCRSGSSFLSECGSAFGSGEPTQHGSMRIQNLVRLESPEADFSDEIQKKVFGFFPLATHSHLYNFSLRYPVSSSSTLRNLLRPETSTKLYVHEFDFWIRIRIRIPNTGPDPGQPDQCGSMWIEVPVWTCSFPQIRYI